MLQVKNNCQCVPRQSLIPAEIARSDAYMIECEKCGHHVMVRMKSDFSRIRNLIVLPVEKPLNLRLDIVQKDFQDFKKFRNDNPNPFSRSNQQHLENRKELLYEMLADGDITLEQFNNHIYSS